MTDKDQAMLKSALWHISNSVTNGKSQTAECELTKWLKNKINPLSQEQPSEDLEKTVRDKAYSYYLKVYYDTNCRFNPDWDDVKNAFIAGANWQKEHDMIFS